MKKILSIALVVVLLAGIAVSGTMAYLTDTDSAVNVMTLGNVQIEQIEQERDANGGLQDFTQDKPLYPAVYDGTSIPWAAENEWVVPKDQAWKVVADNDNVVDKFVTVKNTGKSDAYVRTLIAYEGDETYGPEGAYIHVVSNGTNVDPQIPNKLIGVITVNDVKYTVYEYVYPKALAAGETTIPSLKQVYLDKTATNEVCEVYGDTYEILVLSQAVQTAGFDSAAEALNAGFDEVTAANAAEWFGGVLEGDDWDGTADTEWYDETATEFKLETAEALAGFAELVDEGKTFKGQTIVLDEDINLIGTEWEPIGVEDFDSTDIEGEHKTPVVFEGTFDGQNHTIYNLNLEDGTLDGAALFGATKNATIKNLKVENVDVNGYSVSAAIVGRSAGTTIIDNCHVSGDINIVSDYAYAGGIMAYGYAKITNCSVIADGTGVIKATDRNAVGGICGWMLENSEISGCTVKNIDMTGWANIGAIAGFANPNNKVDGCVAENITLTKTRVDGLPSIGLAVGGYSYNASIPITITNNSFDNITLNGTAKPFGSYDILYGSEYIGSDNANFVLSNNAQSNIVNNLIIN